MQAAAARSSSSHAKRTKSCTQESSALSQGVKRKVRTSMAGSSPEHRSTLGVVAANVCRAVLWQIVYAEIVSQLYLCTFLLWLAPFVPRLREGNNGAWRRAYFAWSGALSPRLLLQCLPLLGRIVQIEKGTKFEEELRQVSFFYRLFEHAVNEPR